MRREYTAFGWWQVSTEGDCEGRSTKDLGIHHGYLDDIAFQLGNKAYYRLCFKAVDTPTPITEIGQPTRSVHVQLDIDSGTWDMNSIDRAEALHKILKDRPVVVGESNYYASVLFQKDRRHPDFQ